MTLLSTHQVAALSAMGRELLAIVQDDGGRFLTEKEGSLAYSEQIGRVVTLALLASGEAGRLNRVSVMEGAVRAIGGAIGLQSPENIAKISQLVQAAFAHGLADAARELEPRERA